jgi:hypothetical protein
MQFETKDLKVPEVKAIVKLMEKSIKAAGAKPERSRMALRRKAVGLAWINRSFRHPAINIADILDLVLGAVKPARCAEHL